MSTKFLSPDEALDWLSELFGETDKQIIPETKREDVPSWDSLGDLMLMADLDKKFQIVLSDSDLQAMTKIADVLDYLRKNGNLSE